MNQSLGLDKLQQTKRKKMKLRFGPQIAAKSKGQLQKNEVEGRYRSAR